MPNLTDKRDNSGVNKKFKKKFNNKFPNWTKLSKDKQKLLLNAFCILYFYKKQNTFFQKFCRGFRKGSYSFADTLLILKSQSIIIDLQNELFDIAFSKTLSSSEKNELIEVNELIAEFEETERLRLQYFKIESERDKDLEKRINALRG